MKKLKFNQGLSSFVVLILIAIVVVAGVAFYVVGTKNKNSPGFASITATTTNPCDKTQIDANGNATTTLCKGDVPTSPNVSSGLGFNGNCDWSGVHSITQYSVSTPGKVEFTLEYNNGKVSKKLSSGSTFDMSAITGVLCNTAALSSYQSYSTQSNANTNGTWFAAGPGQININKTTFGGQEAFVLENRSVSKVQPGYIYVSQMIVSAKTFLLLGHSTGFASGTDLQLSKSIVQLAAENPANSKPGSGLRAPTLVYSYQ